MGLTEQQQIDALRIQLEPLKALRAADPGYPGMETDNTPAPAPTTKDPHRITFVVENSDETIFSLGESEESRIDDRGITGRTKKHVHFDVTDEPATFLSLGGPSSDAKVKRYHGAIPGWSHGYVLLTNGTARTESKQENYILSSTDNVAMRAPADKKAVTIQADSGDIQAFGGKKVSIISQKAVLISSDPGVSGPPGGEGDAEGGFGHWLAEWWHESTGHIATKAGSTLANVGEVITTAMSLAKSASKVKLKGKPAQSGQAAEPRKGIVKGLADVSLLLSTYVRAGAEFAGLTESWGGSLTLYGQKFTSVTGGISASMYGGAAAAVVSAGQAEVLGGVSAVLKSLAWTEVSSTLLTGISSLMNVEIEAVNGNFEATAKKEVKIDSEHGKVIVSGKEDVQLNSHSGGAFVHGHEKAYLAGGPGVGFGILANEHGMLLGRISADAGKFGGASFDDTCGIELTDHSILTTLGTSYVKLDGKTKEVSIKGAQIHLLSDDGMINLANGKILIGH